MNVWMRATGVVPLLAGGFLLVGCGGDVRSEAAPGGERLSAETPAPEMSPPEDIRETAAPEAGAQPTPAPAPRSAPPAVRPERTETMPPPPLQPTPAEQPTPERVPTIPVGTEIGAELTAALSTEANRAGDRFSARVQEDVLGADGLVLVPRGSEIRGRVTEALESPGADQPAILRLAVESLVIQGREIPITASVTEAQLRTEARDSGARTAAKVATGAAAGAVMGRILGRDGRSTAAGAVAGAAAGTAVALATRDGHAVMEAGSRLVIRLDAPVWD